jgi:hypothetical protein
VAKTIFLEYGETCIPGKMDNLHPIFTVADVKLWCDESHGYSKLSDLKYEL